MIGKVKHILKLRAKYAKNFEEFKRENQEIASRSTLYKYWKIVRGESHGKNSRTN